MGCLLVISTRTRPDITAAVCILCPYTSNPNETHWVCLKRIIRYLQGTKCIALRISAAEDDVLTAVCDAVWAGDGLDRSSTTRILLQLGQSTIAWKIVKQSSVTLSTTEADFVSLSECTKLVLWLRSFLHEFGCTQERITVMIVYNQGAIGGGTDGVHHAKHVAIRRNFVKENGDHGLFNIKYCTTQDMTSDILTKRLGRVTFEEHRNGLGVTNLNIISARSTRGGVEGNLRNARANTWDT